MKPFQIKMNKYLVIVLGVLIAIALFIVGKGTGHEEVTLAAGAVVSLSEQEKTEFNEGEQKLVLAVKKMVANLKDEISNGKIPKEEITAIIGAVKADLKTDEGKSIFEEFKRIEQIAKDQGTTLSQLGLKMNGVETGNKSIGQVLEEAKDELKEVYQRGSGQKTFMVQVNHKGEFVAKPFDLTSKAADAHATIANIGGNGGSASIAQSIDAASLLRLGGDSTIISQYRNTPWIFDLCNIVNAGFEMPLAMWFEEQAKQGASTAVLEGGTKPKAQYSYTLKSATYKKEAVLLGFSEEFSLDFARLQSDILGKGRVDLVNRINSAVLARLNTAATAYNTGAAFQGSVAVPDVNDYDAIAAMAAQVENSTFGAVANAAVMSTYKKYRQGIWKDTQGRYLNRPDVLQNLAFVSNPDMATDDVMVGDFKQYNILMRGGLIVRVGYNGTDFAENKFSTVMEQFYFDYISTIRAVAIVKGSDFATVKSAISS
jgi:hypothetical protein